jgi:hypothetical protein
MHDVIGRMTTALLREALLEGTLSWELTLQRCLALCFMASLSCRAGEITRSDGYDQLETLQYKHITIHLEPVEPPRGPSPIAADIVPDPATLPQPSHRFVASFELHYCKGEK